ncbi:hypothetical protein T05_1239 [Trichinella murrelli]|uniref:Uncharacterized protein n=1 Tax=Trichinella murrelli TaxID=144512 RepID=A0A0V0SZP2_9BILA|nr:hypothetical protein T05_1239 [Trichinella murrelli]
MSKKETHWNPKMDFKRINRPGTMRRVQQTYPGSS